MNDNVEVRLQIYVRMYVCVSEVSSPSLRPGPAPWVVGASSPVTSDVSEQLLNSPSNVS